MTSDNLNSLPPGHVIRTRYLEPSGLSVKGFAEEMGLPYNRLLLVLSGEKRPMKQRFIKKLSQATSTDLRFWYNLELEYLFEFFLKTCKISILPIKKKRLQSLKLPESLGKVLYDQFIAQSDVQPRRKALYITTRKTKIHKSTMKRIVYGKRRVNFSLAKKLASGLNTSIWYWMDLQNKHDIKEILQSKRKHTEDIKTELVSYYENGPLPFTGSSNEGMHYDTNRPGKVLFNKFILPTGIPISKWCYLLFITKRNLKRLIDGKEEFSIEFIIKLSKIFKTGINYWLFLQSKYYSSMNHGNIEGVKSQNDTIEPLKVLQDYVKSANWKLTSFARHIGVDIRKLYRLGGGKLDFETAVRIGQGLNMDPKFWLHLCLDNMLLKKGKG
jgi:plasmid maintenance system antidote protein VapI